MKNTAMIIHPNQSLTKDVLAKATNAKDLNERLLSNTRFSSSNLHEWIFHQFTVRPADNILELCCGTGTQTEIFAQLCTRGTIYAIDASKDATGSIKEKNMSQVRTITMDMDDLTNLPMPEQFFDIVFCSYGLYYSHDSETLLRYLYRLLKSGGCLIIVGPYGDNNKELWELIQRVYPIDKDILFTCTGYMSELVEPVLKSCTPRVHATYFENQVEYPTPESLLSYINASTVYKSEYRDQLKKEIKSAFLKKTPFGVVKKAVCLIAEKN